jgi:hypothetical protein
MSVGLYPVFDPVADTGDFLGETLASELAAVDAAAEQAAVRALSAYSGWPDFEVPDGFDGDPDELRALMGPPTWHAPQDLRKTIAATRKQLAKQGAVADARRGQLDNELAALDALLAAASRRGCRVYLDMM